MRLPPPRDSKPDPSLDPKTSACSRQRSATLEGGRAYRKRAASLAITKRELDVETPPCSHHRHGHFLARTLAFNDRQ